MLTEHAVPWFAVLFLILSGRSTSWIRIRGESLHDWQRRHFGWNYIAPFSHYVVVIIILLVNQTRWGALGVKWGHWTVVSSTVFGLTLLFFGAAIVVSNSNSGRLIIRFPGWSTLLFQGLYIPIGEELFWRGYFQLSAGLWMSAVAFGLLHALNQGSVQKRLGGALYAGILGLVFGYLRVTTGGIIAGVILHSAFNVLNHLTHLRNKPVSLALSTEGYNTDVSAQCLHKDAGSVPLLFLNIGAVECNTRGDIE